MVNIAVLGYGTVGSGVVEVINTNREQIQRRIGNKIDVKYVLDLKDFPDDPINDKIVHDYDIMGVIHPAYEFVKAAREKGKCVCTSNKELVAKHGAEFLSIAKANNINFLFEASVGGGIPIIRAINACMTADKIEEITGILNGTTNYMLTNMYFDGADYDAVLKDAQKKGFAEAHPEADVEGFDACRKIAILSSLISGRQVDFEDIHTEGITRITSEDILYAKTLDYQIKLLATSKMQDSSLSAIVAPFFMSKDHPLYNVNGVFNAIFVHGNVLGDAMFYGSGAGKLPTASAVVADIVDASKHLHRNIMTMWEEDKLDLIDIGFVKRRFFVRMKGDKKDYKNKIEADFGKVEWIENIVKGEFGFITEEMSENKYQSHAHNYENIITMIRFAD